MIHRRIKAVSFLNPAAKLLGYSESYRSSVRINFIEQKVTILNFLTLVIQVLILIDLSRLLDSSLLIDIDLLSFFSQNLVL